MSESDKLVLSSIVNQLSLIPQIKSLDIVENDIASLLLTVSTLMQEMSEVDDQRQDNITNSINELVQTLERIRGTLKMSEAVAPVPTPVHSTHYGAMLRAELSSQALANTSIELNDIVADCKRLQEIQLTHNTGIE